MLRQQLVRFVIVAAIVLVALPVSGQWVEGDSPASETPWTGNSGPFGAILVVTDDSEGFFEEWNRPPDPERPPSINSTQLALRGERVDAILVFTGCQPNPELCDVAVDYRVLKPDGSTYAEQEGVPVWKGAEVPEGRLQLSEQNLGLAFEPDDPLGVYRVEALVRDRVADRSIALETELSVSDPPETLSLERVIEAHQAAVAAQNRGDRAGAEKYHREVVAIVERMDGFPGNEVARQYSNLASVLTESKPNEAFGYLRRAIALLEEEPSADPGQYIVLYLNQGLALLATGEAEPALAALDQAAAIIADQDLSGTSYAAAVQSGLGRARESIGDLPAAIEHFTKARTLLEELVDDQHVGLIEAREDLARVEARVRAEEESAGPADAEPERP